MSPRSQIPTISISRRLVVLFSISAISISNRSACFDEMISISIFKDSKRFGWSIWEFSHIDGIGHIDHIDDIDHIDHIDSAISTISTPCRPYRRYRRQVGRFWSESRDELVPSCPSCAQKPLHSSVNSDQTLSQLMYSYRV